MKIIKQIFFDDVKQIATHFFALVIAIGVCFISPLYAWCNIYSNWDPYGNTGNLKMAVVSLDKGFTADNGVVHNNGRELVEKLHKNTKIDWQFVSSKDKAIEGVRDGSYYGAIIVTEDFSYNMYNIFLKDVTKPTIEFYQNQKKNPVANKITDTVVESLQTEIDTEFIKIMSTTVFDELNGVSEKINEDGGIDNIVLELHDLDNEIKDYEDIIDTAVQGNQTLVSAIASAENSTNNLQRESKNAADSLNSAKTEIDNTDVTLEAYSQNVNTSLSTVETSLSGMKDKLNDAKLSDDINDINNNVDVVTKDAKVVVSNLDALSTAVSEEAAKAETDPEKKAAMLAAQAALKSVKDSVNSTVNILSTVSDAYYHTAKSQADSTVDDAAGKAKDEASKTIDSALTDITGAQATFNNSLKPEMQNVLSNLSQTVSQASDLMNQMSSTLAGMGDVFNALSLTINSGNTSLTETKKALETISGRLENAILEVNAAKEDEKVKILINTLSGNPEKYGKFFSEPVKIDSTVIYPVENYGSSVTPFYTALALWVGGILLVAIIKVRPDMKKYPDAKPYQSYFGRLIIFIILGEFSALVTVIGDLNLLHVQCKEPGLFIFTCLFTGFVFTLFIYSLVFAFRDAGKAIAVVIVVLQIAGSSGTYPIELLPSFFRAVYKYFPFPYAINAMRECIGGLYGGNIAIYLLELSVFILISLIIGLVIQKAFHGVMHFMEKRMEDTEMM